MRYSVGHRKPGRLELPLVDHRVVARGQRGSASKRSAIASCATTRGGGPAVGARFFLVEVDAEHVVDVAVGEDRGVEAAARPAADRVVHRLGVEHAAGVDDDQPVVGVDRGRVGEGVDEGDAGLDLGQLPAGRERVVRRDGQRAGEQLVGEVEDGPSAARRRRSSAVVAAEIETCSNSGRDRSPSPPPKGALARSQAARRRRVLDATLAARGRRRVRRGADPRRRRRRPTSRSAPSTATSRRRSGCCSRRWPSSRPTCARYLEAHPPLERDRAGRACRGARRANRSLREHPDVTAAMVRAFGSAQTENADIVRRVTEIMTAIITQRDPRARERAPRPRVKCASRASSCRCGCRR